MKMVLTVEFVDELLKCNHGFYFPGGTVYYAIQGGFSRFESEGEILKCDYSSESYTAILFIMLKRVVETFDVEDKIPSCSHLVTDVENHFFVVPFPTLYKMVQ